MGKRFEYRCSYCLTNMSLREFLDKMQVEHQKTEMDYEVKRYPWSKLTEDELEYCIADVLGLYEALVRSFKIDKNKLSDVPMTSTGYVRKRFKHEMRSGGFIPMVHECAPDYDVYLMIRRAFRGGNTHANRCYTGIIMENVSSYDRASSYPDVLVNYPYPVKPFIKQDITEIDDIKYGFPYLLELEFTDLKQRDPFNGCPYLAVHKCYNDTELTPLLGAINDNGRVLEKDGTLVTFCTDIDWGIIKEQYTWSSTRVVKAYRSEYGMLPKAVIDTTMEYYRKKTELKGVAGQEVFYNKSKALLNSIYGMMATNPVRTKLVFNGIDFSVQECNEEEELAKTNSKSFVCYSWGCWCTSIARKKLQTAIDLCGHKFIYCDTDSVKYVGTVDFTELNAEIQAISEKHKAYADDPKGNRRYLGVYEPDAHYKRFVTLGAKKYAYEDDNGKLHITISGVSKDGAEEMGCLENFKEGFIFRENAGMEAVYNDQWHDPVIIDGHTVEIPPNIYLHKSTYELGLTGDYKKLFYLTQESFDRIMKTM